MLEWYTSILPYRVTFGVAFFVLLGVADLLRNPRDPKRAREYLFLLAATVAGTIFGVVHDQLTVTISPEYFTLFKGLRNDAGLRWTVALLAVQATYWVGAVGGTVLLVANNPSPRAPQLSYRALTELAWRPLAAALAGGIGAALAFRLLAPDLSRVLDGPLDPATLQRARMVWMIHCGSYLGGACGIVWSAVAVRRLRSSR